MRASSMLVAVLVATAFAGAAPAALAQQPGADSAARGAMSVLRTRQGSVLIGHVTGEGADSVRFETAGGVLTFARTDISELKAVSGNAIKNGSYWFPDPNGTRLFFAPTGRMLRQGEGYFSSTELFLQNVVA